MKFESILVAFVCLCGVNSLSRKSTLHNAFFGIMEDLSKRNHLLTLVLGGGISDDEAALTASADVPHITATWIENKTTKFQVNYSAIVLLDSLASIKAFNRHANYSLEFSI